MHAYSPTIPTYLRSTTEGLAHCPLRQGNEAKPTPSTPARRRRLLPRLLRRREPTTFQRCLAVHMHMAARNGALD